MDATKAVHFDMKLTFGVLIKLYEYFLNIGFSKFLYFLIGALECAIRKRHILAE